MFGRVDCGVDEEGRLGDWGDGEEEPREGMSWEREGVEGDWAATGRREGKTAAHKRAAKVRRKGSEREEAGVGEDMRVWERGRRLPF